MRWRDPWVGCVDPHSFARVSKWPVISPPSRCCTTCQTGASQVCVCFGVCIPRHHPLPPSSAPLLVWWPPGVSSCGLGCLLVVVGRAVLCCCLWMSSLFLAGVVVSCSRSRWWPAALSCHVLLPCAVLCGVSHVDSMRLLLLLCALCDTGVRAGVCLCDDVLVGPACLRLVDGCQDDGWMVHAPPSTHILTFFFLCGGPVCGWVACACFMVSPESSCTLAGCLQHQHLHFRVHDSTIV